MGFHSAIFPKKSRQFTNVTWESHDHPCPKGIYLKNVNDQIIMSIPTKMFLFFLVGGKFPSALKTL